MVIAALDDLMFSSKVRAACEQAGKPIAFARTREAALSAIAAEAPELVILDLDREALDPLGIIAAVRADAKVRHTRLVAFVRHTNTDAIVAARQAGADVVLARSAFFPALPGILSGA
jgi:PleD family two-component response regulator